MSAPTNGKRPARILVVEDEKNLAAGIVYNLEKQGHEVQLAERGDTGLEAATKGAYDLVVLDVMLPGLTGFDVCAELRARQVHTPVLMLTARHETENRIKGIRLGADDYLGKPFDLQELLARVEALLRRRHWDEAPKPERTLYSWAGVEFDSNLLELREAAGSKKQRKVTLTAIEARLLQLLADETGKTISRAQILKTVWGLHEETQTRTLDNFIMRLRHHFDDVGGSAEWIESVRGVGYRFKPESA